MSNKSHTIFSILHNTFFVLLLMVKIRILS